MTASGRYASPDSSFGRSTSNAAARGGALIVVAVVIGFLLLWQGGVGGSDTDVEAAESESTSTDANEDDAAGDGGDDVIAGDDVNESTDTEGDAGDSAVEGDGATEDPAVDPTPTEPPVVTRPPGEVLAAVANGTDTGGLAGARSGELTTAGYVSAAVNAFNDTSVSNVFYIEGYGEDAAAVAEVLGGDASVLRPATADEILSLVAEANRAEVEGYHILVVLGTDQVLG